MTEEDLKVLSDTVWGEFMGAVAWGDGFTDARASLDSALRVAAGLEVSNEN